MEQIEFSLSSNDETAVRVENDKDPEKESDNANGNDIGNEKDSDNGDTILWPEDKSKKEGVVDNVGDNVSCRYQNAD